MDHASPVCSWNEWDRLEEVVVGIPWGAHAPTARDPLFADGNGNAGMGGLPLPPDLLLRVHEQIEAFAQVLIDEGVVVRRPTPFDLAAPIRTPFFSTPSSFNFMNARDLALVVGDQIIECPTAARSRHFEILALRPLFKDYFRAGARWTSAPRPALSEDSFQPLAAQADAQVARYTTSDFEPLFDAADFVRCGQDLFCQRGFGTNPFGIHWLKRHLGADFRIHEVGTRCPVPMHIDTTFMPLGPGRALVNPHWIGELPPITKDWELIMAPDPEGETSYFQGHRRPTSPFIAMNVFSLDERRVFVDVQQKKLIRLLEERGFEAMAMPFDLPPFLGGAFHCVTLDIRRSPRPKGA